MEAPTLLGRRYGFERVLVTFLLENTTNFRKNGALVLLRVVNGATILVLYLFGYFANKAISSYLFEFAFGQLIIPIV
jgi:hypothetical protein